MIDEELVSYDTKGEESRDRFLGFIHFDTQRLQPYLLITLQNNLTIELSHDHLIAVCTDSQPQYKQAKQLQIRDRLCLDQIQPQAIISISNTTKQGLYAPLTYSGTLYINGILVSNYV